MYIQQHTKSIVSNAPINVFPAKQGNSLITVESLILDTYKVFRLRKKFGKLNQFNNFRYIIAVNV